MCLLSVSATYLFVMQFYRAILLVPDVIDRLLLRDYMNLLLSRLGFEAALIQQVNNYVLIYIRV